MTVTKIADEDKKERRQRRTIIALFSICLVGFSYLVYDYFGIVNRATLPEDLSQVDQTIHAWRTQGFVVRFDTASSTLVVNGQKWAELTRGEKVGIVTQLARYSAKREERKTWSFLVVEDRSHSVVGELGPNGLLIQ